MSIQAAATLRPTAPSCEAKLRLFDNVSTLPPYCQRQIALGSFLDANGVRRFHCQAEGHREKVAQLYGVQARWALDAGEAVFDAPGCYLCYRTAPILDGRYTAIDFGREVGIQHVCDDCGEKAD